jgi:Spy/CpxP family protein refolding chaperone
MKHLKLFLFLILVTTAISVAAVHAQDDPPPEDAAEMDRPNLRRPNLLAELGLSAEQVRRIRRMNQERRPMMVQAQERMRMARENLDLAIYSDSVSDADFQARLKEFQTAEAELARLRFEGEMSVRKLLTPEQLVRFRDLRRRFAEQRRDMRQQRRRQRRGPGFPPMQEGPIRRPVNN